jgi:hypothetical protein
MPSRARGTGLVPGLPGRRRGSVAGENGAWEEAVGLPACHNVTVDAGVRSRVTLATLTDLNVTIVFPAKSVVTLTPLTVVNVTR